ncbi:MAG: substrate-binding domain-containing protein [Oculatellaceae cyanobacterium Prado106]|jgi:phosphate transport system substrate-binding protein|nr:substrate-binding domain-containing protein [Oculatellaceae cyanobacterium Prado106]
MTTKNESRVLILSLLVTVGLIGSCVWFLRNAIAPSTPSDPTSAPTSALSNSTPAAQSNLPPVEQFSQVQNVPSGIFNYGGSTSWAPIRGSIDLEIQKTRPEFRLNYVQQDGVSPSTQSGIDLLAQGKVAFSLASRLPSNELLQKLASQGIQLRLVPVANSFDVVIVNPSLPLTKITPDQAIALDLGKVENWKELGGPDLPVQYFDRNVNPDTLESRPDPSNSNILFFSTPLAQIKKIAEEPQGFAVFAAPLAVPQCSVKTLAIATPSGQTLTPYKEPLIPPDQCKTQKNQINLDAFRNPEYPSELKNTLYVVIHQNGKQEQQVGEAYANFLLSNQGQALLEKAGYLRIR